MRIIAGRWRRRQLPVPGVRGLRPTPDRVRETLFNWLDPHLPGARCLDLYAGTGSLGFEAASRGAQQVTLVERDRVLVANLREQARVLGAEQIEVIQAEVEGWLRAGPRPHDVVLLDPPFADRPYGRVARLLGGGWLAPEALVYLESALPFDQLGLPGSWRMLRSNKAGQVRYHLASVTQASRACNAPATSTPDEGR